MNINQATPTRLGTVMIPFQGSRGEAVLIEVTRAQWKQLHADVRRAFEIIDRQADVGAAMLAIDRHESVV